MNKDDVKDILIFELLDLIQRQQETMLAAALELEAYADELESRTEPRQLIAKLRGRLPLDGEYRHLRGGD